MRKLVSPNRLFLYFCWLMKWLNCIPEGMIELLFDLVH